MSVAVGKGEVYHAKPPPETTLLSPAALVWQARRWRTWRGSAFSPTPPPSHHLLLSSQKIEETAVCISCLSSVYPCTGAPPPFGILRREGLVDSLITCRLMAHMRVPSGAAPHRYMRIQPLSPEKRTSADFSAHCSTRPPPRPPVNNVEHAHGQPLLLTPQLANSTPQIDDLDRSLFSALRPTMKNGWAECNLYQYLYYTGRGSHQDYHTKQAFVVDPRPTRHPLVTTFA